MEIKFDVFWPKNLGTLYKDSSIDILGREFTVDLDLKEVKTILVEFKSDVKSFTDLAEIVDIEKRLVRVPFRGDATRYQGVTSFELVAIMKNGETKPSQTYTYSVARSLQNPNNVESDSNYPILVDLLRNVENKVSDVDKAIENIDNNITHINVSVENTLTRIVINFLLFLIKWITNPIINGISIAKKINTDIIFPPYESISRPVLIRSIINGSTPITILIIEKPIILILNLLQWVGT